MRVSSRHAGLPGVTTIGAGGVAGWRDADRAGLSWLSLETADSTAFDMAKSRLAQAGVELAAMPAGIAVADPWGTRLRITHA